MMVRSVSLFLFWLLMAQCRSEGLPTSFTDVLYFQNGDLDNFDTAEEENQDKIRVTWRPVLIPALQKDPVLYEEEIVNGKLYRRIVAVRNESSTDLTLHATYYNLTNSGHYEPGTLNTDDLAKLTRDDFNINEGCPGFIQKVTPQTLVADWADCRHTVNGKHPVYAITSTCNDIRGEAPLSADETSGLAPYIFKRRRPRFPLNDPPEGYVRACQGDHQETTAQSLLTKKKI